MDDCRSERLKAQNKLEDEEDCKRAAKRQYKQIADALRDEEVKINRIDVT